MHDRVLWNLATICRVSGYYVEFWCPMSLQFWLIRRSLVVFFDNLVWHLSIVHVVLIVVMVISIVMR